MLQHRPISELTPRMQQLFERARTAFQGGRHSYSVELLRSVLKQEPGCADVRRVLHAVYREIHAKDTALRRGLAAAKTLLPLHLRVPRLFCQEQYEELSDLLEDLLYRGAPPRATLRWLARLAETCHLPETGTVALESLVTSRPNDAMAWRAYIDHCRKHDLHKRALQGLQRLGRLRPLDTEIQSELRQVTAADTVAEARWDQVATYRDVLRDETTAQQLEDEKRPAASIGEDAMKTRIANAKAAVAADPNAENRRRLGDLLRQSGDLDGALAQYEAIGNAAQYVDPTLDEAIVGCLRARTEQDIQRWRDYGHANAAQADLASARIAELKVERDAMLLAHCEGRAKRFPMEARYQAELGGLYLAAERFDEALRCYQSARRNPGFNLTAGIGAARCLAGKGLRDLAEREFMDCLALAPARSRERLGILYELAGLYRSLGRHDDAFAQLKEVYAIDASYRDVADQIGQYVRERDAGATTSLGPNDENAG